MTQDHLTAAEEAALPEHMRYPHAYRYHADGFDNREAVLDAVADRRAWLATKGFYQQKKETVQ